MKIIFLDRDGTINEDNGYISQIEDFEFLPNTIEGLRLMQDKGYILNIITNQSGIGRGLVTPEQYKEVTEHMITELAKEGISIDNVFHCPHIPERKCKCRKPHTGMIKQYIKKICRDGFYVIGDKSSDLRLGERLTAKTILVLTGMAGRDRKHVTVPNYIANDLLDAAENIIQ